MAAIAYRYQEFASHGWAETCDQLFRLHGQAAMKEIQPEKLRQEHAAVGSGREAAARDICQAEMAQRSDIHTGLGMVVIIDDGFRRAAQYFEGGLPVCKLEQVSRGTLLNALADRATFIDSLGRPVHHPHGEEIHS